MILMFVILHLEYGPQTAPITLACAKIIMYLIRFCIFSIDILSRRNKLTEVEKHERLPPHPNCVHFIKAWEERGHLYIQTELCKMRYVVYHGLYSSNE